MRTTRPREIGRPPGKRECPAAATPYTFAAAPAPVPHDRTASRRRAVAAKHGRHGRPFAKTVSTMAPPIFLSNAGDLAASLGSPQFPARLWAWLRETVDPQSHYSVATRYRRDAPSVGRQCRRAVLRGRRRSRRHSPRARSDTRVTGAPTRCSRISSAPPIRSSCSRATRTSIRQPNTAAISRSANSAKTARCSAASATMFMRSRCSPARPAVPYAGRTGAAAAARRFRAAAPDPACTARPPDAAFGRRRVAAAVRTAPGGQRRVARERLMPRGVGQPVPQIADTLALKPSSVRSISRAREARRGEPGRAVRVVRDRRRTTGDRGQ